MRKLLLGIILAATGLLLVACGSGSKSPEPTATTPPITATVSQVTETPIPTVQATVESKYDEAWAREQVEPYLKETDETLLAQEWNKRYDQHSAESKVGCSRTVYVSKAAGLWLVGTAFGLDEILKAELQDLKEGVLPITFSEITPERITFMVGIDENPYYIIREKGRWVSAEPLEQDCASLDTEAGD